MLSFVVTASEWKDLSHLWGPRVGDKDTLIIGCGQNFTASSHSSGASAQWKLTLSEDPGDHKHRGAVTMDSLQMVRPDILHCIRQPIFQPIVEEQFTRIYCEEIGKVVNYPMTWINASYMLKNEGTFWYDPHLAVSIELGLGRNPNAHAYFNYHQARGDYGADIYDIQYFCLLHPVTHRETVAKLESGDRDIALRETSRLTYETFRACKDQYIKSENEFLKNYGFEIIDVLFPEKNPFNRRTKNQILVKVKKILSYETMMTTHMMCITRILGHRNASRAVLDDEQFITFDLD